ncbi:MAG TPA: phospholipase D-like domain-containing protein [Thermoanaerobaculia bacterium]|nr:phospholipase D-like domain-containing protein [Thermoanaerobaculia bacterium]
MIEVPLWLVVLTVLTVVALVIIVWSLKRRRRPHLRMIHFDDTDALMQSLAGATLSSATKGNRVELIQNGRFFDRLFADIENARSSVSFETFLSKDGEVTKRLAELLARKSGEGVEVRVTLDGSGGREFPKQGLQRMHDGGCQVVRYNPLHIRNLGLINNRTHRKIAVIDGRIGYVGGHCLVDSWLGDAEDREHFRDITARVEGPVVAELQSTFINNWIKTCGEVPAGPKVFPDPVVAGDVEAHIVYASPAGSPSMMKVLHYAAIHTARHRLWIQNPYFLPDPDARDALVEAVKRGVDLRIMIPSADATDSPIVQHASHHHYGTLLKGGVRIFEYRKTLLHQKVLVVDSKWASIGSSNFDDRSFEINDEVSLVVYDDAIAAELERTFEADLEHCIEPKLEQWQRRPALHKLRDGFSFLFNEQL